MKYFITTLIIIYSSNIYAQDYFSNVKIEAKNNVILKADDKDAYKSGHLSTGELIRSNCDHGACDIIIEYKESDVRISIGDDISKLLVTEIDLGNDGDNELLIINEFYNTKYMYVYKYSKGILMKLFEYEIGNFKTVIKNNYIELYILSRVEKIWHFYKGQYWELKYLNLK